MRSPQVFTPVRWLEEPVGLAGGVENPDAAPGRFHEREGLDLGGGEPGPFGPLELDPPGTVGAVAGVGVREPVREDIAVRVEAVPAERGQLGLDLFLDLAFRARAGDAGRYPGPGLP